MLRYIADRGGATVGEVAAAYGEGRGLARSTVLTMMERLRKKGSLNRRLASGVYRYTARASSDELTQGAIHRFVERNLGGIGGAVCRVSHGIGRALRTEELKELQDLVARLQPSRKKEPR